MTAVTEEVVISFSKIAGALRVTPEELLEHVFGAMPATSTSPEELSAHSGLQSMARKWATGDASRNGCVSETLGGFC